MTPKRAIQCYVVNGKSLFSEGEIMEMIKPSIAPMH